jgi:hypothetical protein
MRSRSVPGWIPTVLALVVAAGCSKSTTAPTVAPPSDQAQVTTTLAAASSLVDDPIGESTLQASATHLRRADVTAIQAAITPYKWWQTVNNVSRTWSFAFSDTDATGHPFLCTVTLTKHVTGQFVIVPLSDTTTTIQKPLDKTFTRQILLQRLLINGDRVWKVVEVTGSLGSTPPPYNTSQIVSVHLVATGVDTTLTDPQQFFSLRHVIRFAASDTVHLTVTTTRTDDPVFIHLNGIYRWRLHNNLDNTYSTQWVTSAEGGWRHMGIQVMTYATLYDDVAPVDTRAWHFPFRVLEGDLNYYP